MRFNCCGFDSSGVKVAYIASMDVEITTAVQGRVTRQTPLSQLTLSLTYITLLSITDATPLMVLMQVMYYAEDLKFVSPYH